MIPFYKNICSLIMLLINVIFNNAFYWLVEL